MGQEVNNRDLFWQEARGLCIVAVIMAHLPIGEGENVSYWLSFRQIINFPVACFLFISGFFSKSTYSDIFENGGKRLQKLVIPYLFWSVAYTAIFSIASLWTHTEYFSWHRVVINLFLGQAASPLYFIIVLIQLTLITPVIHSIVKSQNALLKVLCLLITPIYLLILYSYQIIHAAELPYYAVAFPAWFSFYYMGVYIKYHGLIDIKSIYLTMGILFAIILSLFESNLIYNNLHLAGFASSQIKCSSFIYAAILCICFYKLSCNDKQHKPTFLSRLGDYSYSVYYIHLLILIPTSIVMDRIHIFTYPALFIFKQAIITCTVVTICYYLVKFCHRILPVKLNKILGA